MFSRSTGMMIAVLLISAGTLHAEDIFLKGKEEKPIKTTIKTESVQGISDGKDQYRANDIYDVYYDITPISVKTGAYKQAKDLDLQSVKTTDTAARKNLLEDAGKKYAETLKNMDAKDESSKHAKRHFAYKVAMFHVRSVMETGAAPDTAISELTAFADKNPNSWQTPRVLETLGKLQLSLKKYVEAEDAYKKLASLSLPDEAKQEAEMMSVQITIQSGRHKEALKTLQTLASKLPKESRFAARVKVAQAECLIGDKQIPEAQKLLNDVMRETNDNQIKAIAHNNLGTILYNKDNPKEALWQFLFVDVVYNQDKAEHAKALYYLWKIFGAMNDAEHAQECREMLLSSTYNGLEYQVQLKREAKLN